MNRFATPVVRGCIPTLVALLAAWLLVAGSAGAARAQSHAFGQSLLDWQLATRGVGTYDTGYLMSQSVNVDVRRAHEEDLVRLYHRTLIENGVQGYSFEACWEDYRWAIRKHGLQTATGALANLWDWRGSVTAIAAVGAAVPMGRLGEPAEIGGLAVYLASDASSYMTGSLIVIDGGRILW